MNEFKTARNWLDNADAVIISAGNGLSITEGYNIFAHDEAFMTHFGTFYERYGIMNILQGAFYNYPTVAERDAFYKVLFDYMVDHYESTPVFRDLKQLVGGHEYFVVTSNGNMHFQLSGFDEERIFEVEGNFGNNQNPMPMIQKQQAKFNAFVQKYRSQNVVILELGIGANNQLIKALLMQLVAQSLSYRYITLNLPHEINIPAAGMSAAAGPDWYNPGDLWGFKLSLIHFVLHEPVYQPYQDLKAILKDRDYDLITTNQDVQFSKAFPDKDVATIQGDWSYFQCADKCHDQVYPNQTVVDQLFPQIENGHLPENLIPRCPKCGAEMLEWVRGYEFLEGQHYNKQYAKYRQFIQKAEGKKTVYLELGVGMMTPMFIKEPFMNLTYQNSQATYITVNPKDAIVPRELMDRGIAVKYDLVKVLANLKECGISRISAED